MSDKELVEIAEAEKERKKEEEIAEIAEIINNMSERNAHYYDKNMQVHEAFADAENIAKALCDEGYRKERDVVEEVVEDFVFELKTLFREFWDKHDKICVCEFGLIAEAGRIIKEKYKEKKEDVD